MRLYQNIPSNKIGDTQYTMLDILMEIGDSGDLGDTSTELKGLHIKVDNQRGDTVKVVGLKMEGNIDIDGDVNIDGGAGVSGDVAIGDTGKALVLPDASYLPSMFNIDPRSTDDPLPNDAELFEFNTLDCVSSKGRRPTYNNVVIEKSNRAEFGFPGDTSPWVKWDDRSVVFFRGPTGNLVVTDDLDDFTKWNHISTYHSNYGDTYDSTLKRTVWKWERGSATTFTYIYDNDRNIGPAGYAYKSALWLYAGDTIKVQWYIYPTEYLGDTTTIPANTWKRAVFHDTPTNNPTGFGFRIARGGGGAFDSGTEFRACEPHVEYGTYYSAFAFPHGQYSYLTYKREMKQTGTIEFWMLPQFPFDVTQNKYFISDFTTTSHFYYQYYVAGDRFRFTLAGDSGTVSLYGDTYDDDLTLQTWMHVKFCWDIPNTKYKLFINGVYKDGDTTTTLTHTSFNEDISIGAIPLYTTRTDEQEAYSCDSYVTDLCIQDVYDETTTHYTSNRPYYATNRILGKNCNFKIDDNGFAFFEGLYGNKIKGTLEFISKRATKAYVACNPSVSWTLFDFSNFVPEDTVILFGFIHTVRLDATALIVSRPYALHIEFSDGVHWLTRHGGSALYHGHPGFVYAPNGKFEVKEYSSSYEADTFSFYLWGYVRG